MKVSKSDRERIRANQLRALKPENIKAAQEAQRASEAARKKNPFFVPTDPRLSHDD